MAKRNQNLIDMASNDEHIIRCSECGRNLIVKDIVNNAMAFLSHLKNDHGITYTPQRMTDMKRERKRTEKLILKPDLDYNFT